MICWIQTFWKHISEEKKYVHAIYLAWATIYWSYIGISCHAPARFWIDFFLPFGKSRMLGSDRRHITNTLHGFTESEFDKSLFRQWLANNGYIKVYDQDVTSYTAYIPIYTGYIYCHDADCLCYGHRQAFEESVNVIKSTTFLCLQAFHKLADSLFHASCIRCIKTLLIFWWERIRIPLIMLLLWTNGWLYHLPQGCITMRSTKSWSEICWSQWCILGYTDMSSIYICLTSYILDYTWYIPSYTYVYMVYTGISLVYVYIGIYLVYPALYLVYMLIYQVYDWSFSMPCHMEGLFPMPCHMAFSRQDRL